MDMEAIRKRVAESDLRKACKYGQILIAEMAVGNVEVVHQGNGFYKATRLGKVMEGEVREPEVLAEGRKAAIVAAIAPLYNIIVDGVPDPGNGT